MLLSLAASLVVILYTIAYAIRTWQGGNRRGGLGLLVLTGTIAGLTAYVLFRP